ncbi:MAG: hypothetical protein Q8S15_04730 [Erysipelotrichaceae bacterium]|nr:hypothetical protein [Erysipelotrichaceae bacterium]MDP3305353.1 hypothetical protein [Erysipelotrichaceae bacterium]
MKNYKTLFALVIMILILSATVSIAGILTSQNPEHYSFTAITKETVTIYGTGIYKNDSVSVVAQGIASDMVTLFLAVPATAIALFLSNKNSFRAQLTLTGLIGYFLYTYMSYTFLWNYNPLFILYTALMSLSLFAFIFAMTSFELTTITQRFSDKFPIKRISGYLIAISILLALLWLGKLAPTFGGAVPAGLEHYTTLIIQGMDLGFIVPAGLITAYLLIKRRALGYLLSSVLIVKGIAMLIAISMMIVNMMIQGVNVGWIEIVMFFGFTAYSFFNYTLLLKYTH